MKPLFAPELAVAPDEKYVDLKQGQIGSAGSSAKIVRDISGLIHEPHDLGKQGSTVVVRNERCFQNYYFRLVEDIPGSLQNLELVSLDVYFDQHLMAQGFTGQEVIEPFHRHLNGLWLEPG